MKMFKALSILFATALGIPAAIEPPLILEDRMGPEEPGWEAALSPDWAEPVPAPPAEPLEISPLAFASLTPAARQPQGVLSGRIVYMNGGHGWTYDPNFSPPWRLLRPAPLLEMNEDYGNIDQLNFFAMYCYNAGAVVVPFRPLGQQTNEVVLDNVDPGVTFSGSWVNSSSAIYYGAPGAVPYRYASFANTETATATYTPTIPLAGFYPIYTWVRHGSDRGSQLYRIRHTGGESHVRIPHDMVGNGWVYLGEYYFNAGANAASGSVIISNLRETAQGTYVFADAIRFGNGMGSADNGGGGSKYPREDESARYWIKNSLGQGQSATLYDGTGTDEQDSWSAPPKMSAEMNRGPSASGGGSLDYKRIHISFHSNAGGGRGTLALITGTPTTHQARLAQIAGKEVNDDLVALGSPPLEVPWFNRTTVTYTGSYGEITGSTFNYEMDATIIEVAFHDNDSDARLMRDSKARAAVGKASMHAVVKYFNEFDGLPLAFLPEAPTNPRAIAVNTSGHITLSWTAPVNIGGSQNPTNYIIYVSTNGYGFGNPIFVGNVTSFTVTNLPPNVDYYFRVAASNAGGESMPSEVVGCRASSTAGAPKVLVVNAFDRFDRTTNLRQNVTRQPSPYVPPGATGVIERVWPRRVNSFDYVVAHGQALTANGRAFDSCQNEAVANNQVALTNYAIVVWACGNESVADETFSAGEQLRISAYLSAGGALFASGADIAYDLDRPSGPTTGDRSFLYNRLHVSYGADNSGSYTTAPTPGGIFAGRPNATFDNGNNGIYWVKAPDVLVPVGSATAALNYTGGTGGAAAVQYDGAIGSGRVVVFGFPFETITSAVRRQQYMADILNFLSVPPSTNAPPAIVVAPADTQVVVGSNATLTVLAGGSPPLSYQWRFNGTNLAGATSASYTRNNAQFTHSGFYDVVVSNAWGISESDPALLEVTLPPHWQTTFSDHFDVNTAANWMTNRSSTDTRVTFNYNYAADGIPSAPNTVGGTTRGVKFEANMVNGVAAAINISPTGQSFSGDYRLRFDMWINANGPFPLGGTGSTEHLTAGVGTAGSRVQWTGAGSTADGFWFAVNGEGQASDTSTTAMNDFDAFRGTTRQAATSGVFAAGTASTSRGNGNSYYAGTFPGGQTAPALQQANHAQQTGGLAVGTVGFAWRDVIINKTGSTVEWFINGLKIATLTDASFTASNIFIGYWDSFNSLSDNAALSFGLVDNVRVERLTATVPPYIIEPPAGDGVKAGTNVTFTVTAGGDAPLAYQWRFNSANLPGATNASYTRLDAQTNHSGIYAVVVTNASGSVTSAPALLSVIVPVPLRFELVSVTNATEVRLVLSGEPGVDVALLVSTNLMEWTLSTNLPNPSGTVEFVEEITPDAPQKFYRAESP